VIPAGANESPVRTVLVGSSPEAALLPSREETIRGRALATAATGKPVERHRSVAQAIRGCELYSEYSLLKGQLESEPECH
jgi:hypothetical protein